MKKLAVWFAALGVAAAARAESPEAAFARVDQAKIQGEEARGRVATVVQALNDAGMPRSATVLLSALAADPQQSPGVREAAKAALAARASQDVAAQLLLAREDDPGALPPVLAVLLARDHLERALQLTPPDSGAAFDGLGDSTAALQPAAAEIVPLDKDLAAEMGAPAQTSAQPAEPAQENAGPASAAQEELSRARALAKSVPAGDPLEPDAREVAALAALAAGDTEAAANAWLALAQLPARDETARRRRDEAYLQLARLAYQAADDAHATALYDRVGRSGPQWLDALFEASWSRFRKAQDEQALGNLLTLHAPFFAARFFPESFVLKAVVLYRNCRYADARAVLHDFEQRYRPLHDGLTTALANVSTPQAASDFLARGAIGLQVLPQAAREEVARLEQENDVQGAAKAAAQLAQEIDSLDRRPASFRSSALVTRVAPLAQKARLALLDAAGRKLVSRLRQERLQLRELLGQALRLSYEISGKEKALAGDPSQGLVRTPRTRPQVADDEEEWPFEGEYWRDELGNYRYQLGRRCKKPRAPVVLASSTQPAAPPATQPADTGVAAQGEPPHRDPALLHPHVEKIVTQKEHEQEQALRAAIDLGGGGAQQAELLARLAGLLRARGLALSISAQAKADAGDPSAATDRTLAESSRTEAIARYQELLRKYPDASRTDEALFFLADTLQDSGRDDDALKASRELTRRFPRSQWAPASHVFIGEHLFDAAKLDEALAEYRAAAEVPSDEVYPYALYKAAWCRFNQGAFGDAMKLLKRVVGVSSKADDANTVQLGREARRDYVLAYGRVGTPERAQADFVKQFGDAAGLKMLQQYDKLLFDTGRDPEAALVARQLLALHGDAPAAALDQTRLLVIAQRTGKRRDLLQQAKALVDTFQRVRKDPSDESLAEAERLGEETLRNLAVQIHNEAKKTDLDETWAAARALYADDLALFPDAADSYDLRFFYGELLYGRNMKAQAAEQYEAVVKQDLASKKPGKWLQKAAWSAVLARNEAIFGEQEEKDRGEHRAQRALTPDEQRLASACRLYLEALPNGPHAVEVAFKVGRLEYLSGDLAAAQEHLASIAVQHPEHELAEYAANLVLDIGNLRKDWAGMHAWAVKFLADKRLIAHGTLAQDLKNIEEESAYALSNAAASDPGKAQELLAFASEHPHGRLADKALFGAAAALSRAGRIDEALEARARVWKEQPRSPLVPRALLASAADRTAVGDLSDAAALLEKYAQSYQREQANLKWRREHAVKQKPGEAQLYDEHKAQASLHDAALLREARGELKQALLDRALALQLWKNAPDREESLIAQAQLHARLGETARAARELTAIAHAAKSPAVQLSAWREAAKLYDKARESGNAQWSWTEIERIYKSLGPRAREKLPPEAVTAAAEAHFALGTSAFDNFRKQRIEAPLTATLNRKLALLTLVKKRAEATVALGQAEPAVCALSQLGEAQFLLAQALTQSPVPPGLNAEQRQLYRAALAEKAQPVLAESRETLSSADGKARELGVTGACATRTAALLEKAGAKASPRPRLQLAAAPAIDTPEMMDARALASERAKRLLTEAMAADSALPPEQSIPKFQTAAEAEGTPGAAVFDLAVAFDRAGRVPEAEKAYRAAASGKGAMGWQAAARLAALAASRGDAQAARDALSLAAAAMPDPSLALRAEIELALGNPAAAESAARVALEKAPSDVRALVAMARARLALGHAGDARLLAVRAAQLEPDGAAPLLVKVEIARAASEPAEELAAARAAVEAEPDSSAAAVAVGRALFERGQTAEALAQLKQAAELDPASYPARLAFGEALAVTGPTREAETVLRQAVALSPRSAEPHFALARLKLDGDSDAQAALAEAKLFLTLSTQPPPPGHPIHALVQRCEEALKQRTQASVVQ